MERSRGELRMYDSEKRNIVHWHHAAHNVYGAVWEFELCARNYGMTKKQRMLSLCLPAGPIELVGIRNLGFLQEVEAGNHFIVVTKNISAKRRKVTTIAKITATTLATMSSDGGVSKIEIPSETRAGNGLQFRTKFFQTICAQLVAKPLTNMEHNPKTNEGVERFRTVFVWRVPHYVAQHH